MSATTLATTLATARSLALLLCFAVPLAAAEEPCLAGDDGDALRWIKQSPLEYDKPNTRCTTEMCTSLLRLIEGARSSIDFAVYGFRGQPQILSALLDAQQRGVQVRGVVDKTIDNTSYYADTAHWQQRLQSVRDDYQVDVASARQLTKSKRKPPYRFTGNIMHNKFFIIDRLHLWTGSANISDTGIGGYNANNVLVATSAPLANTYRAEFEEMYAGKYHNRKTLFKKRPVCVDVAGQRVRAFFSPQSYTRDLGIVPAIDGAQRSIDVAMFFLTSRKIVGALTRAHQRGVKVRVILDATGASNEYSKHDLLRAAGVPLKVENWGGKMHTKSALIDNRQLIVGSMNWTYSGTARNDENTLIIDADKSLAGAFGAFFETLWRSIPERWLHRDPPAESIHSGTACTDGIDNDFDGRIDSAEAACGN